MRCYLVSLLLILILKFLVVYVLDTMSLLINISLILVLSRTSSLDILLVKKATKYMIFNLELFILSRDVLFYEHIFPYRDAHTQSFDSSVVPLPISDHSIPVTIPNIVSNLHDEPAPIEPSANQPFIVDFSSSPSQDGVPSRSHPARSRRPHHICKTMCATRPFQQLTRLQCLLGVLVRLILYPMFFHIPACFPNIKHSYLPLYFVKDVQIPEWRTALSTEIEALERNNTWTIAHLPNDKVLLVENG